MGSFANALFSGLLGWLQGAAAWLWRVFSGADAGAWMSWVLENWLPLTLLLCAAGVLIDFVVYLIRWQPYRVWRSFFGRRSEEEEAEEEAEKPAEPAIRHKWVYADGRSAPADPGQEPRPHAPKDATVQPVRRPLFQRPQTPERRENVQLDAPVRPVKRVTPAKHRRAPDGSDEYILAELTEGEEAYNQPYYPPQWTGAASRDRDQHDGGNP